MIRRSNPTLARMAVLLVAGGLLSPAACSGGPSEATAPATLDREVFIATYVDLRAAAVRSPDGIIPSERRTEILASRGVTEQALLDFAEARGGDVVFMREVWDEVERRLDALRVTTDESEDPPPVDDAPTAPVRGDPGIP